MTLREIVTTVRAQATTLLSGRALVSSLRTFVSTRKAVEGIGKGFASVPARRGLQGIPFTFEQLAEIREGISERALRYKLQKYGLRGDESNAS